MMIEDPSFECWLRAELGPAEGETDRAFVERVQVRISVEERLEVRRRALLRRLGLELLSLAGVGAGLAVLAASADLRTLAESAPHLPLLALLLLFSGWIALIGGDRGGSARPL